MIGREDHDVDTTDAWDRSHIRPECFAAGDMEYLRVIGAVVKGDGTDQGRC
jgi:hypothetical protein